MTAISVAFVCVGVAFFLDRVSRRRTTGSPRTDPEPTAQDRFLDEIAALFRARAGIASVQTRPADFALVVVHATGWDNTVFLGNLYAETRDVSGAERRACIERFIAGSTEGLEPLVAFAEARGSLIPVLRACTFGIDLWSRNEAAAPLRRPFLPFIDCLVVLDRANSMSLVGAAQAKEWGVDESTVQAAAWENLGPLANAAVKLEHSKHGALWRVTQDDNYEASRLLVPGWLANFRGKVEGTPIAAAPNRSLLLVAGDANPEMVRWLLEKAEREFEASPRSISPALYTVDAAGTVIPYVREGADALATLVRVAHEKLALREYQEQKRALDALHADVGPDVFVASYQASVAESGVTCSTGVWTRGVPTWLPPTTRVALVRPGPRKTTKGADIVTVPFERIESRLRPMPHLTPLRYETGEFPSDAELDEWRRTAPPD